LTGSGFTPACQQPQKQRFRHNDVISGALILTPNKPSCLWRHAQIKDLPDTGRIDMQDHNTRLGAIPELLRKKSDATVTVF